MNLLVAYEPNLFYTSIDYESDLSKLPIEAPQLYHISLVHHTRILSKRSWLGLGTTQIYIIHGTQCIWMIRSEVDSRSIFFTDAKTFWELISDRLN